jgi:hypothetical protein
MMYREHLKDYLILLVIAITSLAAVIYIYDPTDISGTINNLISFIITGIIIFTAIGVFVLLSIANSRLGNNQNAARTGGGMLDYINNQHDEWIQIYGIQGGSEKYPHVSFHTVDGGRKVGQVDGILVGNCGVKVHNVVYQMGYLKRDNMVTFKQRSVAPS